MICNLAQDVEQLLEIPILPEGNAFHTTEAIMKTVNEWDISKQIVGLCFDTTNVNSGWRSGVAKRIGDKLQRKLLHFACRHHIYEIVLASVYTSMMGKSTGPDIELFKRFKDSWANIDKTRYRTYSEWEKLRDVLPVHMIEELLDFFTHYESVCTLVRTDYGELMKLVIALLEGDIQVLFKQPGAYHRARWMSRIIYAIKILMLSTTDETDMTRFWISKKEEDGLIQFIHFVIVSGYLECWYRSPIAAAAPMNDLHFLKKLNAFKSIEKKIGGVVLEKFSNHLWYLNQITIGLCFFDEEIETHERIEMVRALKKKGSKVVNSRKVLPKRIPIKRLKLAHFITENTLLFFETLGLPTGFLSESPATWKSNQEYLTAKKIVDGLKVVNDVAERHIAMMSDFNDTITKSENQLQNLFLSVANHRKNNK